MERPASAVVAPVSRGKAAGEIFRNFAQVRRLRGWYWAVAALSVVNVLALCLGEDGGPADAAGYATAAAGVAVCALFAFAAIFVERSPVAWSLVGALALTVPCGLAIAAGAIPGVLLVACAIAWYSVPAAWRLGRLLAENPDLRSARRLRA